MVEVQGVEDPKGLEPKGEGSEEKPVRSTRIRTPRKPKKSQIPQAIVLTALLILLGWYVSQDNPKLAVFLIMGVAFGYTLQRSRFCFTAAVRDPGLTGSTSLARAVLVAFAVTTIGFTAIKYAAFANGQPIPGASAVNPIGIPLVIGGAMFGIGMVISGGCASGTLMRVGEGFTMQLISMVFFVAGSIWGAHDMGAFWSKLNEGMPRIFLPDVFGWFGALVVQGLIILLLYIAAVKWQKKKLGTAD